MTCRFNMWPTFFKPDFTTNVTASRARAMVAAYDEAVT